MQDQGQEQRAGVPAPHGRLDHSRTAKSSAPVRYDRVGRFAPTRSEFAVRAAATKVKVPTVSRRRTERQGRGTLECEVLMPMVWEGIGRKSATMRRPRLAAQYTSEATHRITSPVRR